uniref:Uncharacterized protein n=1 Tax=Panagrolaimus sp. ES5 TaxID=591445 RepID=A0AC34FKG8_9BILA
MTTTAITVKENQVGELQEEINTLVTKTNELIASSSVDPSVAALLQSMTVIIKLLAKQNLNVNNSSNNANNSTAASTNGPAPLAAAPPPPPPIQQLPPLNDPDDEHKDRLIMPIEINSEIQAKCKEMLEKRRKSVRIEDSSSSESSPSSDSEAEKKKKSSKKNSVSDRSKTTTTRTSSTRKPQARKRSSISSRGSADKQNGCTVS